MYYDCIGCGKEMHSIGDAGYCNSCSKAMEDDYRRHEEEWYSSCSLCLSCNYAWGNDPSDSCEAYNMPLYMVKRKQKCKRYKPFTE